MPAKHRFIAIGAGALIALLVAVSSPAQYTDDYRVEASLARRLIDIAMYDYAEMQLDQMGQDFKDRADAILILRGRLLVAQGKRSKAAEIFAKIPRSSKYYTDSLLARAAAASDPADKEKAYAEYFKSLKDSKQTPDTKAEVDEFLEAWQAYIGILRKQGKTKEAKEVFELIKLLPEDQRPAENALVLMQAQSVLTAAEKAKSEDAKLAAYKREVDQAIEDLTALTWRMDYMASLAYPEIARAYVVLGDTGNALKTLEQSFSFLSRMEEEVKNTIGINASPLAPAYYYLGEMFMELGRDAKEKKDMAGLRDNLLKAVGRFHKVANEYPKSPLADRANTQLVKLKSLLPKIGVDPDDLEKIFGGDSGREFQVKTKAAAAAFKAGDYAGAAKLYLEAIRSNLRNRNVPDAMFFCTIAHYKTDRYLQAMALADYMAENFPNDGSTHDALYNLGVTLRKLAKDTEKQQPAQADVYYEESSLLLQRFVRVAPLHPRAAGAAYRIAEAQFAKGKEASDRKNEAVKKGASQAEINELILAMREEYLKAVPFYEVLTTNYGSADEGLKAWYKLGWIYNICDDSPEAARCFLEYCDLQKEMVPEKLESRFLAADRQLRADLVADALLGFQEVTAWTEPDQPLAADDRAKAYREAAFSYQAWCFDLLANKLKLRINDLEAKVEAAAAPPAVPAAPAGGESAAPEGAEQQQQGDVVPVVDAPLTVEELKAKIAEMTTEATAHKEQARAAFEAFLEAYPKSEQVPPNMAKLGSIYVELKNYDAAATWLSKLAQTYPDHPSTGDALLTLGRTYIETGKWAEASATLNKITGDMTTHSLVNLNFLSRQLYADEAQAQPGLDPKLIAAVNAEIVRRADDSHNADYEEAKPKRERALLRQAEALMLTSNYDAAVEIYDRLLRENEVEKKRQEAAGEQPRETAYYFEILLNKGLAYRKSDRLEQSINAYDTLLTHIDAEKMPVPYYTAVLESARALAEQAQATDVRRSIARFLQIISFADPKNAELAPIIEAGFYECARTMSLVGETEEAEKVRNNYQAKFPKGQYRQAIMQLPPPKF